MTDRKTRDKLLRLAHEYVIDHAQEFDPTDPGSIWGDALCDVLGGADYLAFGQVTTDEGAVISVLPVFGEPVHPQQFTIEQLGTVVAAAGEIHDAAPTSSDGLDPGTEAWILSFAVRSAAAPQAPGLVPLPGSPPGLAETLYVAAFWLVNTPGGLLDLTGISRSR